jgi:pentatricopeptide repeat protein
MIRNDESSEAVWSAYEDLLELKPPKDILTEKDFRRIFSRLANQKPRTRTTFLRMLHLCNAIHSLGYEMRSWQWNVLVDAAAKGYHKTKEEDYQAALGVVQDWTRRTQKDDAPASDWGPQQQSPADIYTYTTLLSIAARTQSPELLRHAARLLEHSQLPPTRVTELSVIPYLARSGEYLAVKTVIENVHAKGLEVGIDGLNALMWAYASNGAFAYPLGIYRALRSHVQDDFAEQDLQGIELVSAIGDYIIPQELAPDRATYTLLIQALAYHGHFVFALEVFRDMLALNDPPPMATRYQKAESEQLKDAHLLPIYRALFLGFSRHGEPQAFQLPKPRTHQEASNTPLDEEGRPIMTPWNIHNLQLVYNMFMECATDCLPNNRTIFWILKGFARTTRNSLEKMKTIWEQLDARFASTLGWKGRILRIKNDLENDRVVLNRVRECEERIRQRES